MVRFSVLIPFLFLVVSVYAFPGTKVSLIKNSSFGFGTAVGSQATGVMETSDDLGVEFPGNTGNDADISLVDNVNTGAAFGFAGGVATGVDKNNNFSPYY